MGKYSISGPEQTKWKIHDTIRTASVEIVLLQKNEQHAYVQLSRPREHNRPRIEVETKSSFCVEREKKPKYYNWLPCGHMVH